MLAAITQIYLDMISIVTLQHRGKPSRHIRDTETI
jgi:hypothetical protein